MGSKPFSKELRKSLKRNNPNKPRTYTMQCVTNIHGDLIESFTKDVFDLYDSYYTKWGSPGRKRQALLTAMEIDNITGPALELARLRVDNIYNHQKVWQSIRYRWTDIYSFRQTRTNENQDAVWLRLARGVISRMKDIPRVSSNEWGDNPAESLVVCFKQKFESQNKLCAISKVALELAIGNGVENKCSVDRIDSSKPYTKENIQLVAYWANTMKLDSSMDQFLERIKLIYQANYA